MQRGGQGHPNDAVAAAVQSAVLSAATSVEASLDEQLSALPSLPTPEDGEDDLAAVRAARMAALRAAAADRAAWSAAGHGSVGEGLSEKELLAATKASTRLVAAFVRPGGGNVYATELEAHLTKLAGAHLETRFVRMDAERSPFLSNKLRLRVLPALVWFRGGKVARVLHGLGEVDPSGRFTTGVLEAVLFEGGMLTSTVVGDGRGAGSDEDDEDDA